MKIYFDGADVQQMAEANKNPIVSGFTTNPTLMHKAGITNYGQFARKVLTEITEKPVSFEVFSNELDEIDAQARQITQWGNNVYVKIPVQNTDRTFMGPLISSLQKDGIKINVTAVLTPEQIRLLANTLNPNAQAIISVFAGRIADTGRDPKPYIWLAKQYFPNYEILWASPREVLNIYQAQEAGADIITCTPELIAKYQKLKDYDLNELSLETSQMFYNDGQASGFKL